MIDGTAAPLLYVGPNQINAIVPSSQSLNQFCYGAINVPSSLTATIQVIGPNGSVDMPTVYLAPALPSVFSIPNRFWVVAGPFTTTTIQYAMAFNADGTVNSLANRAVPGARVTFLVDGLGCAQYHVLADNVELSPVLINLLSVGPGIYSLTITLPGTFRGADTTSSNPTYFQITAAGYSTGTFVIY